MASFSAYNFVGVVAVDVSGVCYYWFMKLNLEDCVEMRDSYVYFKEIGHKITVTGFARMFDCSLNEAKKAIDGSHPAYGDDAVRNKVLDSAPLVKPVKRPVGRPRKYPVV